MNPCIALLLSLAAMTLSHAASRAAEPALLVFSKTAGFRHTSIEPGIAAIRELGRTYGFRVDASEDSAVFNESALERYRAVVFLSTSGDVLDDEQQRAFETYMRAGGGFVGIHAAADTEYRWPWYGQLVGARFDSHGDIQNAVITRAADFGTANLPDRWMRRDEWYNFRNVSLSIKATWKLDTSSFVGSKHGKHHPIAWYHAFAGGRAFYTGLGHTDESYADARFLAHLLDGIRYAMDSSTSSVRDAP